MDVCQISWWSVDISLKTLLTLWNRRCGNISVFSGNKKRRKSERQKQFVKIVMKQCQRGSRRSEQRHRTPHHHWGLEEDSCLLLVSRLVGFVTRPYCLSLSPWPQPPSLNLFTCSLSGPSLPSVDPRRGLTTQLGDPPATEPPLSLISRTMTTLHSLSPHLHLEYSSRQLQLLWRGPCRWDPFIH